MVRPKKDHLEFRRFFEESGETNIFRAFYLWQKSSDKSRTLRYWGKKWEVDFSLVGLWAAPFEKQHKRIGPKMRHVFTDLFDLAGITMDEYYRSTPPSPKNSTSVAARKSAAAKKRRRRSSMVASL